MKIAITFDNQNSLFQNGVQQNAIYLAKLLKNSGHTVYLIINDFYKGRDVDLIKSMTDGIKKIPINLLPKNMVDVIITLGSSITPADAKSLKKLNPKLKIVYYKCGNELLMEMESMLWGDSISNASKITGLIPDAIWVIPQMENTNLTYYASKYNQKNTTVVPFIWSNELSELYMRVNKLSVWTNREINRVATMEPNLSVMKNVFIPMVIIGNYIKEYSDITEYHTFSTDKLSKNPQFLQKVSDLGLKNIKFTANGRFPTLYVMNKHADLCLSWQWENNLNYLYLDLAFNGYPVLHNANLCQDIGYYYEGFNIEDATQKIDYIIKNHNNDERYLERNRVLIDRYLPTNKTLQAQYEMLLFDLFNDKFKRYKYNPEKNVIYES